MRARITSSLCSLTAIALITGCGSSSQSSTASTPSTASATTNHAANLAARLPGNPTGAKPSLATVKRLPAGRHSGIHARINGLQGLALPQKLVTLASNVASFWVTAFQGAQTQLVPATVNIVGQTPASCGSSRVATSDAPAYCATDGSIDLPLAFFQKTIEPIGDGAVALVVSNLYGYHIENTLGALNAFSGLTPADLKKLDSCFSGSYFATIQGALSRADELAVNKLLAASAGAPGTPAAAGTVTAADLSAAFNKGLLGNGKPAVCLPRSAAH